MYPFYRQKAIKCKCDTYLTHIYIYVMIYNAGVPQSILRNASFYYLEFFHLITLLC